MSETEITAVFEAISRAEISRSEAERRLGSDLSFGDMLLGLRQRDLRLPRFPSDPASPGVTLVTALANLSAQRAAL